MTLAELRNRLHNRIADAEATNATAPVADTLRLVEVELRQLSSGKPEHKAEDQETLLKAEDVAQIMNVQVRWVYDHADQFPFTRRAGPRTLRFSRRGLEKYLAQSRP